MYDAETDSWSIIAENDEMLGHIHMSVVSFHGSILAFGGNTNGEDNSSTKMVWQLAKRKDVWSWDEFKETLMVPRTQHTSITKGTSMTCNQNTIITYRKHYNSYWWFQRQALRSMG